MALSKQGTLKVTAHTFLCLADSLRARSESTSHAGADSSQSPPGVLFYEMSHCKRIIGGFG